MFWKKNVKKCVQDYLDVTDQGIKVVTVFNGLAFHSQSRSVTVCLD